jgi:flagellar basal body L-ring protein FlgH
MDPITLVTSAVTLLSPYVAKGAEEFAKELGKDAAQKAKELYTYLKNKFSADSEESQVLTLFEKKPEKYEDTLTDVLQERARTDSEFAGELEKHVNSAAPYIKVVQSLKGSKKAVGAEVEKATSGNFDIRQEAENSEEIIGFRAKEVG